MNYKVWNKDTFNIIYKNPKITTHREELIESMDEVMYFYYDIEILDGEKSLFSESVYDFPKVQDLPICIDTLINKKEEKMFLYEDYENNGFHRKKLYDFILLDDMDIEYFYKIERIITFTKQRYEKDFKRYEEFVLTIGKHAPNKRGYSNGEDFGQSIFIKHLEREDILNFKYTAEEFCRIAIENYNNHAKEYKIKCPKCNEHQLYLDCLLPPSESYNLEFKCTKCGYEFDDEENYFID